VVFALPGAFTPTCSSTHVPRYNRLTPAPKAQEVDEVMCIHIIGDNAGEMLQGFAMAVTMGASRADFDRTCRSTRPGPRSG